MNRITIPLHDQQENVYAIMSLAPSDIKEVVFNAMQFALIVTLSSSQIRGTTEIEPVQNVKIISQKVPGTDKTQKVKQAQDSYTVRELFVMEGKCNTINITGEEEIKRFWNWLHEGNDPNEFKYEDLVKLHTDMKKKIEDAKKEAQEREDKEKDANPEGGKLVNRFGEKLTAENT